MGSSVPRRLQETANVLRLQFAGCSVLDTGLRMAWISAMRMVWISAQGERYAAFILPI
jgi:hypothetical protein